MNPRQPERQSVKAIPYRTVKTDTSIGRSAAQDVFTFKQELIAGYIFDSAEQVKTNSVYLAGMTDPFILSVNYKGEDHDYTAQLVLQGYSHKFKVLVNETELYFEPDEEGQYRVVQMPGQHTNELAAVDHHLLALLQQKIAEILL